MSATILTLTLLWGLFYCKHIIFRFLIMTSLIMVAVFLIIVDVSFIIGFLITLNVFLIMVFLIRVTEHHAISSHGRSVLHHGNMVTNLFTLRGERVGTVPRVSTVSINCEDFQESFLTCSTCLCEYLITTSAVLIVIKHR